MSTKKRLLTAVFMMLFGGGALAIALSTMQVLADSENAQLPTLAVIPSFTPSPTSDEPTATLSPTPSSTDTVTLRPPPTFEPPTATRAPSETPTVTETPTLMSEIVIPGLRGGETLPAPNLVMANQLVSVCTAWQVLTPVDYGVFIDGSSSLTFNWRGPRAERNLIRVRTPSGGIWERVIDLRQNETINLADELREEGQYSWQVYPLDENYSQINCPESPIWTFFKGPAPTHTPEPVANSGNQGGGGQQPPVQNPPQAPNNPPTINVIDPVVADEGQADIVVPLTLADADGDMLVVTVVVDDPLVVTATYDAVMPDVLTLSNFVQGMTTITVTVNDGNGGSASTVFTVMVNAPAPISSGPIEHDTPPDGDLPVMTTQ